MIKWLKDNNTSTDRNDSLVIEGDNFLVLEGKIDEKNTD